MVYNKENFSSRFYPSILGSLWNTAFILVDQFVPCLVLAALVYLPVLILNSFLSFGLLGIVEFFASRIFYIIVFISMPFLFRQTKIYPLSTLRVFYKNFLIPVFMISTMQMAVLFFLLIVSLFLSIAGGTAFFMILWLTGYLFILYAGHFLMFAVSPSTQIKECFMHGFQLVKANFFFVFVGVITIWILGVLPQVGILYSFDFPSQEVANMASVDTQNTWKDLEIQKELPLNNSLTILQEEFNQLVKKPEFRWSFLFAQILSRILEALFLSVLLISLLRKDSPGVIIRYLFGDMLPDTDSRENHQ